MRWMGRAGTYRGTYSRRYGEAWPTQVACVRRFGATFKRHGYVPTLLLLKADRERRRIGSLSSMGRQTQTGGGGGGAPRKRCRGPRYRPP